MNLFNDLMVSLGLVEKNNSASTARDRLKVVVSHSSSRRRGSSPDYLPMLEKDILAVIAKYVAVDEDKVKIRFERRDSQSTLEVNVDLPTDGNSKSRSSRASSSSTTSGPSSREELVAAARAFGDTRSGTRLRDTRKLVETDW